MRSLRFLLLVAFSFLCPFSSAISCIDGNGHPVDWYAMLKTPNGDQYARYASGQFKVIGSFNDALNPLRSTLNQIYNATGDVSYMMFNDEQPDGKTVENRAHMKGVVGFDHSGGFWLIHSVPRFPPVKNDGYIFPNNEFKYGQSFMCLTLSLSTLETVAQNMQIEWPNVYESNVSTSYQSQVPNIMGVISGKHFNTPMSRYSAISTAGGKNFIQFAKNKEWDNDLGEFLVEPYYKKGMMWETWLNGKGKIPSYCTPQYPYDSLNVVKVALKDGSGVSWTETQDHSKWGITLEPSTPIACIGGINRQEGQRNRGGGTVCTQDSDMWKAFFNIVAETESCPSQ